MTGGEAHAGLPAGTRVVDDHADGRLVRGRPIYVREYRRSGLRSYDVHDDGTDECLHDESFTRYPTDADLERVAGWIDVHRPDLQEDATL